MMKTKSNRILLSLIIFLLSNNGFAQIPIFKSANTDNYTIIDSCLYEVRYSLKTMPTHYSGKKEPTEDVCILQIGNKLSKSYSQTVYENDSLYTSLLKKGADSYPALQEVITPIEIYKNYSKVNYCITTYRTMGQYSPVLLCEEEMPNFDWKINPEKKEILGYSCSLATTSYRGRDFEVWFTPDIPIFDGPWKFGGLPGLILHVHDTEEQYVFECIGFKQMEKKLPIKYWDLPYKKVNHGEYMSILKRMYKTPKLWLESVGSGLHAGKQSHLITFPFNELELE